MKRYQVSKNFYVTLCFLVVGLIAMAFYGFKYFQISRAKPYVMGNSETVEEGDYVRLTLDHYLSGDVGAVSQVLNGYHFYTVPIGTKQDEPAQEDLRYAWVGISKSQTLAKMPERIRVRGQRVFLIARVTTFEEGREANLKWYDNVPEFDVDQLIQTYWLKEESMQDYLLFFVIGSIGLMVGTILFLSGKGIRKVYVRPFEDSSDYKDCFLGRGFDLEKRLQKEEENLRIYQEQQRESWKSLIIGGELILAGIVSISLSMILGSWFMVLAIVFYLVGIPLGCYLILASFRWFWDGFINSGSELAYKISDLFLLRTTSIKIEQTYKLIGALKRHGGEKPKEEPWLEEIGRKQKEDNAIDESNAFE